MQPQPNLAQEQETISMRADRSVVVPDFQDFGIGPKLSDNNGQLLINSERMFYSVTHHPKLGYCRQRSKIQEHTSQRRSKQI